MIYAEIENAFYGNTPVLHNVNISVEHGTVTAIIGPSGCGKSTFLKILCGLHRQYDGNVSPLQRISYMPQSSSLLPWKTVLQNTVSLKRAIDKRYEMSKALELLNRLQIENLSAMYPRQLSGGQIQRVALARAYFMEPQALLMDEPFSALDEATRAEMHDVFLNMQKRYSITTVCITHSIDEALTLGDKIAVFNGVPGTIKLNIINDVKYKKDRLFYERMSELRGAIERE